MQHRGPTVTFATVLRAVAFPALLVATGACGAAPPARAPAQQPWLSKLEPQLRERYVQWRDRHGAADRARAQAIVRRWQCSDASYDERRGVSRCAGMPAPSSEEDAQLEAARLVLEPQLPVAVWLASEQAAVARERDGIALWFTADHAKIRPLNARDLGRTVFEVRIFPLALDQFQSVLARPGVLRVRYVSPDWVDPPDDPM